MRGFGRIQAELAGAERTSVFGQAPALKEAVSSPLAASPFEVDPARQLPLQAGGLPISGRRIRCRRGSTGSEYTAPMDFNEILYEVDGPLALVTVNRPARHNAISLDTLEELHGAVRLAATDDDVRVIAITGAGGRAFASGSDLSEVLHRDFRKALEPIVQGLADQLERTPKPTIAAIDGICMGGGLEVALGCDLRIATHRSRFATPEGKLGIIPGGGATARLPRIVGRGWAMEMMLMGEPIDAQRALSIGLVTRLVEPEELLPETRRVAEHLASFAPFVPRTMKAMVNFGMEASLAGALMLEKYAQGALVQTEDKQEGISAFLEKRKPDFKGR